MAVLLGYARGLTSSRDIERMVLLVEPGLGEPGERRSNGHRRADFPCDSDAQTRCCPAGKSLTLSSANGVITGRRSVSFRGARTLCEACPLKAKCLEAGHQPAPAGDSLRRQQGPCDPSADQGVKARMSAREG